ncbi:MAG: hypothetical protein ABIW79_01965, partial [Gemmatimonas sp.]
MGSRAGRGDAGGWAIAGALTTRESVAIMSARYARGVARWATGKKDTAIVHPVEGGNPLLADESPAPAEGMVN